jgi:hypothetical protein
VVRVAPSSVTSTRPAPSPSSSAKPRAQRPPVWCSTRTLTTPSAGAVSVTVRTPMFSTLPRDRIGRVGAVTTSRSPSAATS